MSRNPQRSWAMILQQAWSLRLRDRLVSGTVNFSGGSGSGTPRSKSNEACRQFNRGKCNFGSNCKYNHRCSICWKFGHPAVRCRCASNSDKNRNGRGLNQSFTNETSGNSTVNHGATTFKTEEN